MKKFLLSFAVFSIFALFGINNANAQCAPGEVEIEFELLTDTYPYETTFNVIDLNTGNVVLESGSFIQWQNAWYTFSTCVPENSPLVLNVFDSFGDGIYNPGGFDLFVNCTGSGTTAPIISEWGWNGLSASTQWTQAFMADCSGSGTFLTLGCTDPAAANYDPNANWDDGSCVSSCPENNIQVNWTGGSYIYEVGWQIVNNNTGAVELSMGNMNPNCIYNSAGYDYSSPLSDDWVLCLTDDCYNIQMADNFGDGWNGGILEVVDLNSGAILYSGGLTGGFCEDEYFSLGGAYCPTYGCMDPTAINYDPLADADDGSCVFLPTCNPVVAPHCESFENGLGIFVDHPAPADQQDWTIGAGGTPSSNTGPSGASDGISYAFLETSTGLLDDVAGMTACYDITGSNNLDFSFDYHMYGATMGTLTIVMEAAGVADTAWSLSGDQGNQWHSAAINLGPYAFAGVVSVTVYAQRGSSYTGDISIDNVCVMDAAVVMGCTDSAASNFDPMANTDDGSCCYGAQLAITWDTNDSSEYWELLDASGDTVITMDYWGADSAVYCLDTACYTLVMHDDWAGAWFDSWTVWDLSTGSGTIIYSTDMTNGSTLQIEAVDLFGLGDCVSGCTDPLANNYNPSANIDDNSCTYDAIAPMCEPFNLDAGIFSNGTSGLNWSHGTTTTPSFGTGPDAWGDANGGSGFMFVESSSPNYPNVGPFELKTDMDLSALSDPLLTFDYHMYGITMGSLEVLINGTSLWSASGDQGDVWHSASVPLDGYTGIVEVMFSGWTSTSFESDMSIDNVCFDEDPCAPTAWSFTISTTDESAAGMSDGSGQVDASGSGGGDSWELFDAAGNLLASGSGTTLTASGLAPGTYDFTFTDQNGCFESGQFTINAGTGDPCIVTVISQFLIGSEVVNCANDGTIFAEASGGQIATTGGYTYDLYDDLGNFIATGSGVSWTFIDLSPGSYSVTATDDNGCTNTDMVDVTSASGYCFVGSINNWEYIMQVGYSTVLNPSGYTPGIGYEDFTSISGDVLEGTTMDVTVDIGVWYSFDALAVWVDWNDDYCFDPLTEEYSIPTTVATGNVVSVPVPMGALGPHTMRIRVIDTSTEPIVACDWLNWGEAEDYTVNVISDPCSNTVIAASVTGTDESSFAAADGSATASATGGTTPYTYDWDNGATGATATGLAAGTYTVTVTDDNGCTGTASVTINPGPQDGITGTLKYVNDVSTPMENVTIDLIDNGGNVTGSVVTDATGYYEFWQTYAGDYSMLEAHGKAHGGVNTTDALVIQLHSIFSDTIDHHLLLRAGDVNNSGYINSSDALEVRLRFIQSITSFDIADWLYDEDVITHPGGVMVYDYESACAGDVNGSYVPPALRMPSASFTLSDDYVAVDSYEEFTLPVRVNKDVELGAVSLVLHYPAADLELQGISMAIGNDEDLMYSVEDDMIRISWMNVNPISVEANQDLFNLTFKSNNLNAAQNIEITMDELDTEFANGLAQIIELEASTPQIRVIIDGELAPLFTSYPSPFTHNSTIEYTLMVDGYVNLYMFNTVGELIQKLENGIETRNRKEAGNYKLDIEGTGLENGMYVYVIEIETDQTTYTKTIRTIKSLK